MTYLLTAFALLLPMYLLAEDKVIHIYQSTDISNHHESSDAIQKGIEIAFNEIGNEVDGYKIVYKYRDDRGNVVQSKRNYQEFIDDPKALAIYSGINSPPLIKYRRFINEEKALTLVPWAAGGPITRHPSTENWIFRLSIDDTQAGPFIINFALQEQGCKKPHLLLEKTPWGESNLQSMTSALSHNNIEDIAINRFSWNLKRIGARVILQSIVEGDSDCIVLVSKVAEGAVIISEMAKYPIEDRIPIISHWGITGGNFHEKVSAKDREGLDLHFIHSCFAFTNSKQNAQAKRVFNDLISHTHGAVSEPNDLKSAVGFIHAYDLTKILIHAMKQAELTGDIDRDRNAVRLALENIRQPIHGLVQTYNMPFSVFNEETNPNAHEALDKDSYCMGKYGPENQIMIVQNTIP